MAETAVLCPLCERSIDTSESSVLAEKGATAINEASKTRGTSISVEAGNQVHVACRKTFTNKIYLSKIENERRRTLQEKTEAEKVVLRSRTPSFNFQECCFFCTTRINLHTTHRKGHEWYKVRTKDFEESIKAVCKSRDDDWSNNVFRRICAVSDLLAAVTPPLINSRSPIPRVEVSLDEVAQKGKIPIYPYRLSETVLSKVQYEKIPGKNVNDPYASLDQLWLATWFLNVPGPSWNGFMQSVFSNQIHHEAGNFRSKASVLFLPMIDLPSSNESCLYSTLRFVASQGRTYGLTPVLTFDQPLWWKSMKILKSNTTNELSSIVLKLGGFHLMMSFVGCIGHLMEGSGLKEVLELVYATGAVPHILSGKAISRAVPSSHSRELGHICSSPRRRASDVDVSRHVYCLR